MSWSGHVPSWTSWQVPTQEWKPAWVHGKNKVVPCFHSTFPQWHGLPLQSVDSNLQAPKTKKSWVVTGRTSTDWCQCVLSSPPWRHCSPRSLNHGPTVKQGDGSLLWRLIIMCFWSYCPFTSPWSQCNYFIYEFCQLEAAGFRSKEVNEKN